MEDSSKGNRRKLHRKRPLEFEEGNLNKRQTAHNKLEPHDPTRDSSRETTEEQPTDVVWLCGEGQ